MCFLDCFAPFQQITLDFYKFPSFVCNRAVLSALSTCRINLSQSELRSVI